MCYGLCVHAHAHKNQMVNLLSEYDKCFACLIVSLHAGVNVSE